MEILIGADVFPTPSNAALFERADAGGLLKDGLLQRWSKADLRIFNLEGPLTDLEAPIHKCGPALRAGAACAKGIASLKPSCVGLANNHILDQGAAGLLSTLDALSKHDIAFTGAGETQAAAAKPMLLKAQGVTVGVYACAEHEFSIAGEDAPGANPLEELTIGEQIKQLRILCDYLIVLMHGGREHYPYPTPRMRRVSRALAAFGADLTLWQHTHCLGCREDFPKGTAIYGQGNFIFDAPDPGAPCWKYGALLSVRFASGRAEVSPVPIQSVPGGAALMEGDAAQAVLEGFSTRSREILSPGFVEREFDSLAHQERSRLGRILLGDSLALRTYNALTGRRPLDRLYSQQARTMAYNYLSCETLLELMRQALRPAPEKESM